MPMSGTSISSSASNPDLREMEWNRNSLAERPICGVS
jgi:hypothetical protein